MTTPRRDTERFIHDKAGSRLVSGTMLAVAAMALTLTGCVTAREHRQALDEAERWQNTAMQTADTLESTKKETAAEIDRIRREMGTEIQILKQDNARLSQELASARSSAAEALAAAQKTHNKLMTEHEGRLQAEDKLQIHVDELSRAAQTKKALATANTDEREGRLQAEEQLKIIRKEKEQLAQSQGELKRDRQQIQGKLDDLQRRLDSVQQELAASKKSMASSNARINALEKEKEQMTAALTEARDQGKDAVTKLASEQVKVATLREEKQRLMSGITTPKEEIARLQKRSADLDSETVRSADLEKQLGVREQEIARLRQSSAERESLSGKIAALTEELEKSKQRIASLNEGQTVLNEEIARLRQERDQLIAELREASGRQLTDHQSPKGDKSSLDTPPQEKKQSQ